MPTATAEKDEVKCPACGWPQETEADRKYVTCAQCDDEWTQQRWVVAMAVELPSGDAIELVGWVMPAEVKAEAETLARERALEKYPGAEVRAMISSEC